MRIGSTFFGVCAGVTLAATGLVTAPRAQADRATPDPKRAYARPAAVDSGAPANDKVWTLGQALFFDPRLSASATIACATCHNPDQSWTDHLPRAIGEAHRPMALRTPTLLNAGQLDRYGWTGRFADIETVSFFALSSPANMNVSQPQVVARLAADPAYVAQFRAAFPDRAVSQQNVGAAFERYIRSITSAPAPFDRWIAGDATAVSPSAARGFAVFNGKGRCAACHSGWAFTDGSFHDVGIGSGSDVGRGAFFATSVALRYAFKTPTLRNVAVRAPYMHDGSLASLDAVIDHYDRGGIDRPSRPETVRPLHLSPGEKADLLAFLDTLTSGTTFVIQPGD